MSDRDQLVEARERAGLTQGELAEAIGLSQSMVSKIEAGARPATLAQLAAWLHACGQAQDVLVPPAELAGAVKHLTRDHRWLVAQLALLLVEQPSAAEGVAAWIHSVRQMRPSRSKNVDTKSAPTDTPDSDNR